jgi:CheY-like chemotaxis protein
MPKTLLLADDSITIQKVVGITLSGELYTVTSVDNGEDAIAKAREIRPDLVLADVVMPRKNGYEVCETIKNDPALKHIPVLLLAGTFEAFDEGRARAARADGHIAKPFESQALMTKVADLIAGKTGDLSAAPPAQAARPAAMQPLASIQPAQPAQPARPAMPQGATPMPAAAAPRAPMPGVMPGAMPGMMPGLAARPPSATPMPPAAAPRLATPGMPLGAMPGRQTTPGMPAARPTMLGQPAVSVPTGPARPMPPIIGATPGGLASPYGRPAQPPAPPSPPIMPARPASAAPAAPPVMSTPAPTPAAPVMAAPAPAPSKARDPFGLDDDPGPTMAMPLATPRPASEEDWSDVDLTPTDPGRVVTPLPPKAAAPSPPPAPAFQAQVQEQELPPLDLSAIGELEPEPEPEEPTMVAPVGMAQNAFASLEPGEELGSPEPEPAFAPEPIEPPAAEEKMELASPADFIPEPQAVGHQKGLDDAQADRGQSNGAHASPDGGEAQLREALSKASREVIEKIAWEVVPQLAETIIREELDRLVKDRQ